MTEQFANRAHSTLASGISGSDTSLTVASGTPFPATGDFRIVIDEEIIIVGARAGSVFSSLTRGAESTSASAHSAGAAVTHVLTAASMKLIPVSHAVLTSVGTDDHHAKAHSIGGADHTGSLAHSSLSGITVDDHHAKSHVHLADGSGTVAHTSLSTVGADDHHAKSHVHSGDGSGTVDHASLGSVTSDQHHAKSHAHDGADGSGTIAHSATTGRTANDHHNQAHTVSDHTTAVTIRDEGIGQGDVSILNFTGAQFSASVAAGVATITHTHSEGIDYDTIYDEGSALTQRSILNFKGNTVTAADNAVDVRTDVTLPDYATATDLTDVGSTEAQGTAATVTRGDHRHALGIGTTKGDILVHNGTSVTRLAVGANTQVLTADSAQATGVKWAAASGGGNVAADVIWDAKGDLAVGTGADTASRLAVGADGKVLVADSTQTTGVKWGDAGTAGTQTRSIWIQPSDMVVNRGAPTLGQTGGGTDDAIDQWVLHDALLESVSFQFLVPKDWVANTPLTAFAWFSPSVSANNFRTRIDYAFLASGDSSIEASASVSSTDGAGTVGNITGASYALGTPDVAGELVRMNFARVGADALDTNTGSLRLHSIRIDYTALTVSGQGPQNYNYGMSVTVADEQFLLWGGKFALSTTDFIKIDGTGRLVIT